MTMKNKKAAMELPLSTVVTLVLLVSALIFGLILVRMIGKSGADAINQIDASIQNEITKLFAEEGKTLVIYPTTQPIPLKKGEEPKGFAFSVKNDENVERPFTYTIKPESFDRCGSGFSEADAKNLLLVDSGSFSLGKSASLEIPELILLDIPKTAPECTITYRIDIKKNNADWKTAKVYITIKG